MISFIVIAYNEEKNISRTLQAILTQRGLEQFEVIVVNDGSKDNTLAVAQQLAQSHRAIRIIDQPNAGRGAARAAGVAAAKGDLLAFVDADITLPADWLQRCLPLMNEYDACGGTAVPDGDVAYVHGLFGLKPKAAPHTTTVTGSNGLFKRAVFDKVSFNPNKKNGEDVDLGYQIQAHGFKTTTVAGLLVDHNETKSYGESLAWLFVSGIGASRQFYEHKEIRMPDIAFFAFATLLLATVASSALSPLYSLGMLIMLGVFVTLSSAMHLHGKFWLAKTPLASLGALLTNNTLLFAYYLGRCVGMSTQWRNV